MSDLLKRFKIFSKISEEIKQGIKLFHVFDDKNGLNVLFITSDDKVFGFGSNHSGCCGLGHNSVVNEPQIIPELCHKNIKQFYIGEVFILGLNSDNQVYGWGGNCCGELGRGFIGEDNKYFKPNIITFPYETVIQLSCGSHHIIALTCEGSVYGWGANNHGQIGCGNYETKIKSPVQLIIFSKFVVKYIKCSFERSYALTDSGLVYSWGYNDWCSLGHELSVNDSVFEPKMIDIMDVVSICPSTANTYFLTKENHLYFCGLFEDNNCESFQKTPKLLNSETKISTLYSICRYQNCESFSLAFSEKSINFLDKNFIKNLKENSLFNFYATTFELSFKTIQLISDQSFDGNDIQDLQNYKTSKEMENRFDIVFEDKLKLGAGTYGTVFRVQNKYNKNFFAIKRIEKNGILFILIYYFTLKNPQNTH